MQIIAYRDAGRFQRATVASLSERDRMKLLTLNLDERAAWQKDPHEDVRARELLQLAAAHTSDPDYGDAIYAANLALARAALKKGDRRTSVRYLLASVEGPITNRLRFGYVDMTLARQLVDWGEREAVARFLDRCSKFNAGRGKELAGWAADIRRGINPDLTPYHQ